MRGDELVPEPKLLEGDDRIGREDFGIDGELELDRTRLRIGGERAVCGDAERLPAPSVDEPA